MTPSLALYGGPPTRTRPFPPWPVRDTTTCEAVLDVHDHHPWWQNGASPAETLEAWLRDQFRCSAIAVSSGTVGIEVGLPALGIGADDEVLVAATTFLSSAASVTACGATPVPVDVDPATLTIDPDAAEAALTPRTRAIIPVHLAGHPVDIPRLASWARERGLILFEDSAQAITASWDGCRVGTASDAAMLSFHAEKLLPGGSGGALLLRDEQAARRAELFANNGRPRGSGSYDHQLTGTNGRIDVYSAALALARTGDLEERWRIRERHRAQLATALTDAGFDGLLVGPHPKVTRHDHYAVLLRIPESLAEHGVHAATVAAALSEEGVPAKPLFPPWQTTPAYAGHPQISDAPTPHAAHAAATVVALPHRLLLDFAVAADVIAALAKLTSHPKDLLAWQNKQAAASPRSPAAPR